MKIADINNTKGLWVATNKAKNFTILVAAPDKTEAFDIAQYYFYGQNPNDIEVREFKSSDPDTRFDCGHIVKWREPRTLYRYTFKGEGIFQAMRYIDMLAKRGIVEPKDAVRLWEKGENPFTMNLPAPCSAKEGTCWFTEAGIKFFAQPLDMICSTFEKYLGKVDVQCIDYNDTGVYEDDFQVVIKDDHCNFACAYKQIA